jgi:hypothetical protein
MIAFRSGGDERRPYLVRVGGGKRRLVAVQEQRPRRHCTWPRHFEHKVRRVLGE